VFCPLKRLTAILILVSTCVFPTPGNTADVIENTGVVVGLTEGNALFLPAKAISVSVGVVAGALSFILSGGNADLTKQIWRDTTEGPYLITPDVARMAIGQRPELAEKQ
jgi:hypothetical protein